jgi:hypothetical protein
LFIAEQCTAPQQGHEYWHSGADLSTLFADEIALCGHSRNIVTYCFVEVFTLIPSKIALY